MGIEVAKEGERETGLKAFDVFDSGWAVDVVVSDCNRSFRELREDLDDQFLRRALVRNVCALIEVRLYQTSRAILAIPLILTEPTMLEEQELAGLKAQFDVTLSPEEILSLKEELPVVDKGRVRTKSAFLSPSERFRLVTCIYSRMLLRSEKIDFGSQGWETLKRVILIRNRLCITAHLLMHLS